MPVATDPTKVEIVKALAAQGHTQAAIGKAVQLHQTTVGDILKRLDADALTLDTFESHLSDAFTVPLAYLTSIELKLLKHFNSDDVLANLPDRQKESLLGRIAVNKGITVDKKRLIEGKSTSNTSHRIVLDQAHQARNWVESSKGKTPDITATSENPE